MTISLNPLRSTSHTLDRAHFPELGDFGRLRAALSEEGVVLRSERGQIQASDAGSLVSGHRRWENDGVTQSLSETTGAPSIAAGATAGVPRRGGILRPGDQTGVLSLR